MFLIDCKNSMYFSREFSLEVTVQSQVIVSSQLVKICLSYATSQFEAKKTWF